MLLEDETNTCLGLIVGIMNHLSELTERICKLLFKQKDQEKKCKKYKQVNKNVQNYNELAQQNIKSKNRN